ncbi:hypothetical protein [Tardiphaga sp. 709]|uniref:hypothetical protein n=1 Tax=Tardiphaga sp. 709 TaxID=3076039 RepID=UPI0028E37E06|nr:hypothetical protein [Tardiphaga sp. 709]WNV07526.1 hypothetical protein RSO67_18560 [Tardiphaga sp. 709]
MCETKSAAQAALFCDVKTAYLGRIGVVIAECYMTGMFLDLHQHALRIVIDDHSRLPGRFFGRFTTSIVGALRSA